MPATRTPSRLSMARCRTSGWSDPTVTNRVRPRRAAARPRQAATCSKKALRRLGSTSPIMVELLRASEEAETLTR